MKLEDIQIRDPYILVDKEEEVYYLYGSTDKDIWKGPGTGFDAYKSKDLCEFEGPFPVFRPEPDFWGKENFWAPEVYAVDGSYTMFATFKSDDHCRGVQVLKSENPLGPFKPVVNHAITPADWECLDGSLYIEEDGSKWMVFCHEWLQVEKGTVCKIPLSDDMTTAIGEPIHMFTATDASWVTPVTAQSYVTDGPTFYKTTGGYLICLWSSVCKTGYAIGMARCKTGNLDGPWEQSPEPLFSQDGGHCMIFHSLEGKALISLHRPNDTPNERGIFIEVFEKDDWLTFDK